MKLSEFRQNLEIDKRLYYTAQESDTKAKDLELILDVVKNINSSLILDDVLALVLMHAIEITDSERGFIVLKNSDGRLEYKLGMDSKGIKLPEHFFNISTSVVEDVYFTGRSKFIEGAQSDVNKNLSKSILNLALQTILCSPLTTGDKKIGVIYVDSRYLKSIHKKEITYTFEILAGQAAIAIRNAQLYEDLSIAKENAERSDKLKTEFLAQMSHEIRTPLNTVLNSAGIIKEEIEDKNNDGLEEYFDIIECSGKRLIRTVDLILNMSEIQTGTIKVEPIALDIYNDVMHDLYEQYKIAAEEKGLKLHIKKNVVVCKIKADEYCVNQIFANLIDNAIKYTHEGEIKISIEQVNDSTYVSVSDTGIGISKEYLHNLFNPFSQEDQGYSRRFEGNGLGLALVKKYCDLNNAQIEVESEKGKGSTFKVIFNNT
ncbi:MAG: hypothetical protein A2V66_08290 [Ignavibacteria bacterium RBG_13_36_8]|nr:MAG: hypothetical protein A2V66_08290 [Ignavibacteria bacterium RBG_13_36_8]